MQRPVSLSQLWPLSQDVRDIMIMESWGYHRTRIGVYPEPCLMCLNQSSEAAHTALNSLFSVRRVIPSYGRRSRIGLLSSLMGKFIRK